MTAIHAFETGVAVGAVGFVVLKYAAQYGWAAVVAKVKADLVAFETAAKA